MPTSTPVVRRSGRRRATVDRFNPADAQTPTRRHRNVSSPRNRAPRPSETPASPSVIDALDARPNDFTVAEYFAGFGFMSMWAKLAVEMVRGRRFRAVQFVEKDDVATGILRRTFPGVQIVGDIAALSKLEPCRLALAGFPCKGTSQRPRVAGNPNALENLDTAMVVHFFRALKNTKSKPHVMLLENVPGLLSSKDEDFTGGFMRWLIWNLKELGYAGEWKKFSSGDNAQSGDRVFVVCRREGFASVRGSLLSLGGDRTPRPDNGLGFSVLKPGDAPVQGRLACLTEGAGLPCFVFRDDDGVYRCVEFGEDAVADLYTFDREDIAGRATDAKVLKMLANACRPVGKTIVKEVVECMLEVRTPAQAEPAGAVIHGGEGSLPAAGYWSAADDDIFAYEDASKIPGPTIPTERSVPERTAAAFAAECLSSDPPRAELVSQGDIIEYVQKAAMHRTRRKQTTLARHLAALWLAAFPDGGSILAPGATEVNVTAQNRTKGSVTYVYPRDRPAGSEGMPHKLCLNGSEPAFVFVCFQPDGRRAVAFGVKQVGVVLSVQGMPDPRRTSRDIGTLFPENNPEVRQRESTYHIDGLGSDSSSESVTDPGEESEIEETDLEIVEVVEQATPSDARRRDEDDADERDASPDTRKRARSPPLGDGTPRTEGARGAAGQPAGGAIRDLAEGLGAGGAARRGGGRWFRQDVDGRDASPDTRRRARSPPLGDGTPRTEDARGAGGAAGGRSPDAEVADAVASAAARGGDDRPDPNVDDQLGGSIRRGDIAAASSPADGTPQTCRRRGSAASAADVGFVNRGNGGTHLRPDRGISVAVDPRWVTVTEGPVGGRTRAGFAAVEWEEPEAGMVPRGDGWMGAGTQPTQSSMNQVGRGQERLARGVLVDLESLHSKTSGLPLVVWKHIDLYNFQGANEKPNVRHGVHETQRNKTSWTHSGGTPKSQYLTCGKCAGKSAITWLLNDDPEKALRAVLAFEEAFAEAQRWRLQQR